MQLDLPLITRDLRLYKGLRKQGYKNFLIFYDFLKMFRPLWYPNFTEYLASEKKVGRMSVVEDPDGRKVEIYFCDYYNGLPNFEK